MSEAHLPHVNPDGYLEYGLHVLAVLCACQEFRGLDTSCACAQINDRYEFPDELDLDVGDGRLLSENADRSVRNLYKLHSVLVHSGGVHGGHYYAFIRPDGTRWLKFDDERVRGVPSDHCSLSF